MQSELTPSRIAEPLTRSQNFANPILILTDRIRFATLQKCSLRNNTLIKNMIRKGADNDG